MELRYVYRGIEDVIGGIFVNKGHPHSTVSWKVRAAYRESRDLARSREISALCLSAMSAHSSIDIGKASNSVAELTGDGFKYLFPYVKKEEVHNEPDSSVYDECFKMLEEMKRERESREANNENSK